MVIVTRPSWLPRSKMLKTLKKFSLQNHWINYFETLYVASFTAVLQNLYKTYDPGLTFTYFMARSVVVQLTLE